MDEEETKAMLAAIEDLSDEYKDLYADTNIFIDIYAEEINSSDQEDIPEA